MRTKKTKIVLTAAVTAAASLMQLQSAARGDTATWSGTTDALWGTLSNWNGAASVPGTAAADDAIFNTAGAGNLSITNDAARTVRSLQFNANATSPVNITASNTTTLTLQNSAGNEVTVLAGHHRLVGVAPSPTNIEVRLGTGTTNVGFFIESGASFDLNARVNSSNSANTYNKTGGGTLMLTGAHGGTSGWNFTGGSFSVDAGVLVIATFDGSGLASGNSGNRYTVNNGAVMQLGSGYSSTAGTLTINNGGTLRSMGGNRSIGNGAAAVALGGGNATIEVVDNQLTLTQELVGTGGFTKTGAGPLILNDSAANRSTYTGRTTIAAGTITLGADGSLGASSVVDVQSGAALDVVAAGGGAGYTVPANQTIGGNGTVYGPVNLAGANSALAPGLSPGTLTFANDLTLTAGRLDLDLANVTTVGSGVNDLIAVGGVLNVNGSTTLNINRLNGALTPGTYVIAQAAGGIAGAGTLTAPVVRQGLTVAFVGNNVELTAGPGSAASLLWKGNGSDNTWQTNGANIWDNASVADKFFDWDAVTFSDDIGSNSPNLNVNGTIVPDTVNITANTTVDYTFGGTGAITGVNTLTKSGARTATFSNTGGLTVVNLNANGGTLVLNTPTSATTATVGGGALQLTAAANFGSTTVTSGTLEIGNGATAGSVSGAVTNNGWATLNNPGDSTYTTVFSGTGTLEKKGAGIATFSADNSGLTGNVLLSAGTVRPTVNGAFGATTAGPGSVTVVNGAQIDLGSGAGTNSLNFGTRQFNVVGAGPDGSGVLINSHATRAQQNAFQNVRLTGDATFGGTSRFDIRSAAGTGTLDLAGNTLHKIGNTQVTLVGISTVTAGNIHVHNGTFSFETTTAIDGNGTITYDAGTTLQTFNLFGNVVRPIVTNGDILINNASGTASILGSPIRLGGNATVMGTGATPGALTLNGAITNDGTPRSITKNSSNMLVLGGANTYGGDTVVNTGTLQVAAASDVGQGLLANADNTLVEFLPGRTRAVKASAITIGGAGTVDLHDNDLVVGSATAMSSIENFVRTARNNGAWNLPGITSTAARTNAQANTGLGVLSGAEYNSVGGTGTFSGQSYAPSDTLVKYTWNGDANLNGVVNFDDYVRTDVGFNTNLTGWVNGDFNYSGGVNFDDYVMIDVAFNTQSGTLGRAVQYVTGEDRGGSGMDNPALQEVAEHFGQFGAPYAQAFLAAVPEPSSTLALLGVPALAGMKRRRRRRL